MKTVEELKEHLTNCEKILNKFMKKYGIVEYYLKINDGVELNVHKSLNLEVNSEFNDFTTKEVKKILWDLYGKFRDYLEKNNIEYTLYIIKHYAEIKTKFYFKISN
jgi:hypothetical protein